MSSRSSSILNCNLQARLLISHEHASAGQRDLRVVESTRSICLYSTCAACFGLDSATWCRKLLQSAPWLHKRWLLNAAGLSALPAAFLRTCYTGT